MTNKLYWLTKVKSSFTMYSCSLWFLLVIDGLLTLTNAPIRKSEFIEVEEMEKGGGKPKLTFVVVKKDMSIKNKV